MWGEVRKRRGVGEVKRDVGSVFGCGGGEECWRGAGGSVLGCGRDEERWEGVMGCGGSEKRFRRGVGVWKEVWRVYRLSLKGVGKRKCGVGVEKCGECQVSVGVVKKCWRGRGQVLRRYEKCEKRCGGCGKDK